MAAPSRAAAVALALALAAPARAGDPYAGLLPLDPAATITLGIGSPNGVEFAQRARAALAPHLSRALGRKVEVVILPDYDALSAALAGGQVDLAWTTPLAFVHATQRNREVTAIAKARRADKLFYRAAFFVRADSPLRSLADLAGRQVGWVSKSSTSGYLFPRALLAAKGEDPDHFFAGERFFGDHPAVCQAVRGGAVEVGATFSDVPPKGALEQAGGCADAPPVADFRVVAVTGDIPNDVIAARPQLDERLLEPVLTAFARMSLDPEGKRLLREVFRADGWGVAVEGDFKAIADMVAPRPVARPPASPAKDRPQPGAVRTRKPTRVTAP
ncbi:MAG TPA: phosphate/phosphite/phosphonate ABC transporter substrate-binding protein [Anaeromyxobacteraceae bacterium]|jgi:phosphonate transport system substrate-binding protein|nr:phosphate/phosphite/phosphonate ABC transporter substrate-binding protein [Anaeromyxobacteraceae bacterium]